MIREKILEFSSRNGDVAMSLVIIDNIMTAAARASTVLNYEALVGISKRFEDLALQQKWDEAEREFYLATAKFFATKAEGVKRA